MVTTPRYYMQPVNIGSAATNYGFEAVYYKILWIIWGVGKLYLHPIQNYERQYAVFKYK